jgi:hypothetical protein
LILSSNVTPWLTSRSTDHVGSKYAAPPESVTLDIDETLDVVHGHQQLSLFNAH